ncbi:MAG: bifunctional phosphoribosyl-AMP cyclohydrolase/phosphoribosyl-ATP diphosphatase HisIE [Thermoanaerobaculum sp.]|nr:bifunctional phosphoribosyl-AMP cyclohydrolase/phosphoribosyl-ATP diphosphatase HisIE [Thermoanaerobaculum sp.]
MDGPGVKVRFNQEGLVPAVVQHALTGEVLMLGYMNQEALAVTCQTRRVHFFSRSRQRLWKKGESSGNTLHLQGVLADCDQDAVLLLVLPQGPTCHTGATSCFHHHLEGKAAPPWPALPGLLARVLERAQNAPAGSYTAQLLADPGQRLKKLVEEAGEVVVAACTQGNDRLVEELADLLYHLAVVLVGQGVDVAALNRELERRGLGEARDLS